MSMSGQVKNAYGIDTSEIEKHLGNVWYVSANGDNSNSGADPNQPFLTIANAHTEASAGDMIVVGAGTYTELGLTISKQVTILFQAGVILDPVSGTAWTVSATMFVAKGSVKITPAAGAVGLLVSGYENYFENVIVVGGTTAFSITGSYNTFIRLTGQAYSATGLDIKGSNNLAFQTNMFGSGGSTRGFYISQSGATANTLYACSSIGNGNGTAGFECVSGTVRNFVGDCNSGGGDGKIVDAGTDNMWANFSDTLKREYHEHIAPFPDGEGAAGDPITLITDAQDETNGAATTKDYWGEPKVLIALATIAEWWELIGINLYAGTADKAIRGCAYRVADTIRAERNVGNAWDEGATVLTFDDASDFLVDDLIWIASSAYKADGEIVKISNIVSNTVTIVRETSQFGAANTGLRWNHSTNIGAGTLYAYLVFRDVMQYHASCFDFSAASIKDFARCIFSEKRRLCINDGLIVRAQNGTDGTNGTSCDITAIYSD